MHFLYKLDEPVEYWGGETRYVVASESPYINETMVFPSDHLGNILDWTELAVVYRHDHLAAIQHLGEGFEFIETVETVEG